MELAASLAPRHGYNASSLPGLRILRSQAMLEDVPVLYRPGAVFVLQGSKQGFLDGDVYRYDADHYLAVSVPVPFRMASQADASCPLLAVYLDFDLHVAAEIAAVMAPKMMAVDASQTREQARSLVSSPMEPSIRDALRRLLEALQTPQECTILGPGLIRELHFRVMTGPQARPLLAALQHEGAANRIVKSLSEIRERYHEKLTVPALAQAAGMSVASYHAGFKALTGSSPIQYIKAMRLHEARMMIARREAAISTVAMQVGYASPAQFSRDFKRHFHRNPSDEALWLREHIGEAS
ncbi:AraC family transcriptional regulator [Novosphingobium sp. 1949]|uniref:AraC family transcriptional regulator n=1 Tax=Novosphingobium organovorum TaxID=2930092 RepID=A0ABT0BF56_9SPHN|nr:AraC family transcriptional regulator [Novosphingobium organovorum]MCJ2183654.1 AraC family transcriptional regulator [Novosphingobium organovorum]